MGLSPQQASARSTWWGANLAALDEMIEVADKLPGSDLHDTLCRLRDAVHELHARVLPSGFMHARGIPKRFFLFIKDCRDFAAAEDRLVLEEALVTLGFVAEAVDIFDSRQRVAA